MFNTQQTIHLVCSSNFVSFLFRLNLIMCLICLRYACKCYSWWSFTFRERDWESAVEKYLINSLVVQCKAFVVRVCVANRKLISCSSIRNVRNIMHFICWTSVAQIFNCGVDIRQSCEMLSWTLQCILKCMYVFAEWKEPFKMKHFHAKAIRRHTIVTFWYGENQIGRLSIAMVKLSS